MYNPAWPGTYKGSPGCLWTCGDPPVFHCLKSLCYQRNLTLERHVLSLVWGVSQCACWACGRQVSPTMCLLGIQLQCWAWWQASSHKSQEKHFWKLTLDNRYGILYQTAMHNGMVLSINLAPKSFLLGTINCVIKVKLKNQAFPLLLSFPCSGQTRLCSNMRNQGWRGWGVQDSLA